MTEIGVKRNGLLAGTALVLFCAVLLYPQEVTATTLLECYNFTWAGEDNSTSCEDRDQPCIGNLVFTDPSRNPPDFEKLDQYCVENGCKITCKEDKSCIRWNWYDVTDKLINFTLFCGRVADNTNVNSTGPDVVYEGCYKQPVGIYTKEMCVCTNRNKCNDAASFGLHAVPLAVAVLMPWLLGRL